MMDIFDTVRSKAEPLAARMRPRNLDEFVGQERIVGPGRLLRRAIQADQLSSLIFYGPPGTGKTTLAQVIAGATKSRFITLNAVLTGVKDIREAITKARDEVRLYGRRTILFIDEVHRWNKAQQDALLPWVENGTVILVGATTENPYFEVNQALVSRSRIFQLTSLTFDDMVNVIKMAVNDSERGYGRWKVSFEEGALEHLVKVASGDARSLLNALQLAVETTPDTFPPEEGSEIFVSLASAEESIQSKAVLYDKEGDYHFDTISAFIKSIRGSDPDAALYWAAKMIRGGEDPKYLFRRMLISAAEDIGLADPQALVIAQSAAMSFDRVGMPEGQFFLSEAILYLATAPKSNSALGYFDALKTVGKEEAQEVPNHLKDSNRDAKGLGHGDGYLYPHAYRGHWVAQNYLPEKLQSRLFYRPGSEGYESGIRDQTIRYRELRLNAMEETEAGEAPDKLKKGQSRESWIRRGQSEVRELDQLRDEIFEYLNLSKDGRLLIGREEAGGFLLLEGIRRASEGGVWGIAPNEQVRSTLIDFSLQYEEPERPLLFPSFIEFTNAASTESGLLFDAFAARNFIKYQWEEFEKLIPLMEENAPLLFMEDGIGDGSTPLKSVEKNLNQDLYKKLHKAEKRFYRNHASPKSSEWKSYCKRHGLKKAAMKSQTIDGRRHMTPEAVGKWLSGAYGSEVARELTSEEKTVWEKSLKSLIGCEVPWKRVYRFYLCST